MKTDKTHKQISVYISVEDRAWMKEMGFSPSDQMRKRIQELKDKYERRN